MYNFYLNKLFKLFILLKEIIIIIKTLINFTFLYDECHFFFLIYSFPCMRYLYILRGFRKLITVFFTSKITPNLINLSLFLKIRNEVKIVNI